MTRRVAVQGEDDRELLRRYEGALRIDKHRLDDMLVEQPEIFWRVSERLAMQISRRDRAKTDLAEIEADAERELRRSAEIAGDKLTASEVVAAVRLDKGVKLARQHLHKLNLSVGRWDALKDSFSQRSYAIKDLAALHIANYYTAESAGSTDRRHKEAQANNIRQRLNTMRRGQ